MTEQQPQPVDRQALDEWVDEMQRRLAADWKPRPKVRHVPIWDAEREEDWQP
jgi:hypothetical protein